MGNNFVTEVKVASLPTLPAPTEALLDRWPGQSEGDISIMFPEILNQSSPQSLVLISI